MNPGRFILPRTGMYMSPMMGNNFLPSKGVGLFGRIGKSIKSFNWGNLLTNANKTINVVNQTIPLIRQAGPMFNNMKSMLRIARAFGNETSSSISGRKNNIRNLNRYNSNAVNINNVGVLNSSNSSQKKEVSDSNYPNFFI